MFERVVEFALTPVPTVSLRSEVAEVLEWCAVETVAAARRPTSKLLITSGASRWATGIPPLPADRLGKQRIPRTRGALR